MAMTDEEKRAEIERVTKISGFRVMAHQCGASKEFLLNRMMKAAQWGGNPEGSQTAVEAWRIIFMPDFPSVFPTRIAELTSDSVPSN